MFEMHPSEMKNLALVAAAAAERDSFNAKAEDPGRHYDALTSAVEHEHGKRIDPFVTGLTEGESHDTLHGGCLTGWIKVRLKTDEKREAKMMIKALDKFASLRSVPNRLSQLISQLTTANAILHQGTEN